MPAFQAFKKLWRYKGRFLLIGLVIALITTLVLFIGALAEGLGDGNRECLSKQDTDLTLYQENSNLSPGPSRIGRSRLNDISRVAEVQSAGRIGLSAASPVLQEGREPLGVSLIGVEPGGCGEPPAYAGRPLGNSLAREAISDRNAALRAGLSQGGRLAHDQVRSGDERRILARLAKGITCPFRNENRLCAPSAI